MIGYSIDHIVQVKPYTRRLATRTSMCLWSSAQPTNVSTHAINVAWARLETELPYLCLYVPRRSTLCGLVVEFSGWLGYE